MDRVPIEPQDKVVDSASTTFMAPPYTILSRPCCWFEQLRIVVPSDRVSFPRMPPGERKSLKVSPATFE